MDVSDLKLRISADVSDVQKAVEQAARAGLQSAQQQATKTEAALKGAAKASTNLQESLSAISEYLADAGLTAEEVKDAMSAIGGGAGNAAQKASTVASAAKDIANNTRPAAQAAADLEKGFSLSNNTILRTAAGLAGVGLGINVVAGVARLIHNTIASTVDAQANWERSLVQVKALYGDIAPRVVALSQAQAAIPGVISSQTELLQANTAAGYLTTRYGVSPETTGALTTQAARLGGLFNLPEDQRRSLQAAFLDYAQNGGSGAQLQAITGQPFDRLTLARRLGFSSEASLQALTPQQITDAQAQLTIASSAQTNINGSNEQRGLLDAQRALQHGVEQAQAQLQNALEGQLRAGPADVSPYVQQVRSDIASNSTLANDPLYVPQIAREQAQVDQGETQRQMDELQQKVDQAKQAFDANSEALADNKKQLDDANAALAKFGVAAGSSTARLLSFTGSLEDVRSIARGDVAASAQAAVAQRAQSAIPLAGKPEAELSYLATQTAYQDAYQNYVASKAQASTDNGIREHLTTAAAQGDTAAQRALDQANNAQPVQLAISKTQQEGAQLALQQTKAEVDLERIALGQRQRYIDMLRNTVELRLEDNRLQQQSIDASLLVARAQQSALPAEYRASDAQYQQSMAQALAKRRMAMVLRGEDVSGEPSIDQLISMQVNGTLDEAENAPSQLAAERAIELKQRGATEATLAQSQPAGQISKAELGVEGQNLRDVAMQTIGEGNLLAVNTKQLDAQLRLVDLTEQLIDVMSQQPSGGSGAIDLGSLIFGQGGDIPAPQTLPGARRGPY